MCTADALKGIAPGGGSGEASPVPPPEVQDAMQQGLPPQALKAMTQTGGKQLPSGQPKIPKAPAKGK